MAASLRRRYVFKLLANIVSVPVYLLMEAILPRALGPQNYGSFNFATNLFQQLSGFLDMGTSTCFYNALSKRQEDISLFSFYLRVSLLVLAFSCIAALLLFYRPIGEWLMPGIPLWLAPLAALWAFLTWFGRVMRSVNDALGATAPSEIWRASISIVGIVILAALFYGNSLNLASLFLQQCLVLGASILAFWHVASAHWAERGVKISLELPKSQSKFWTREFFNYSHPLLAQSLLSFAMIASERWLLQWFYGSVQQGFYALSQKVSMACFLFVSAMTPLLMREFSIAWDKNDMKGIGALLNRCGLMLYALAAYFSCFTVAEGKALALIFGGSEFIDAIVPVQIMALYPLHQVYGQMAGSVFYASGKTKIPRNLTAAEFVYGLLAAWLLLAPGDMGGLGLGAVGLAIKTVGVQFVSVNLYLWLAARLVPFDFWRCFAMQIICAASLLTLAFLCRFATLAIPSLADFFWLRFFLSGALYSCGVLALFSLRPQMAGLSADEAKWLASRAALVFKKFMP